MSATPFPDTTALIRRAIGLCGLMRNWPREALDRLAQSAWLRQYERREPILVNQPRRREISIVVSGAVAVDSVDADGTRFLLTTFATGEAAPLIRLLEDRVFVYSFHAAQPTVLVHIPCEPMRAVLDAHPLLWKDVCLVALQRSHEQILQQRRRGLGRLDQHVADAVLQLAREQAPATPAGQVFDVQASQSDLAAMLSVSRQSVNKELARLQGKGVLRVDYRRLTVLDARALQHLAEGRPSGTNVR